MSFFFTKKKAERPKSNNFTRKAGAGVKESLQRLGCAACPLNGATTAHPKMLADVVRGCDVYVLGDAVLKEDASSGTHFDSTSGRILRGLIGSRLERCSLDYVVRDYDADKKQPAWVAMECCRNLIAKSIAEAKPKVILGLGSLPLLWMLKSTDMTGLRGRVYVVKVGDHTCYFLPTYSPQYVFENAHDKAKPLYGLSGLSLQFDIERAFTVAQWAAPSVDTPESARAGIQCFSGKRPEHLGQVLKLISEAAKAPLKAIDVETHPLRPYAADARLLTVALSFGNTNFAFAYDHPQQGWSAPDRAQIKEAMFELFLSPGRIVAHNAPFEVEWLISPFGREIVFHDQWECTQMQAHFLDERRGKRGGNDDRFVPNPYQALDFLVKQYFGISFKPLFKVDRKKMIEADLDETLIYNGADTKFTLRLYNLQHWMLKDRGLLAAYNEAKQRQPTVALMQSIGVPLDGATTKKYQKKLKRELAEIEAKVQTLPEIQRYAASYGSFNIQSHTDLIKVLKEYIKVGEALINADGKESTDKGTLAKIAHPIAQLVEDHRNRYKLKSTYVDAFETGKGGLIWPDSRLHPTFNTSFAETGRTSCDGPNVQNFPSRHDKWVRRQIVPPRGHVLVAFDYGQLEACMAAVCSRDKTLVKALWENYDIHKEWAIRAAKLFPPFCDVNDPDAVKAFRGIVKNKLVFPAFFGAKPESVLNYLCLGTGLEVPPKVIFKLFEEFWESFAGVLKWQKEVMRGYYNHGYVESPTGRRRHYPLTRNQAINHPIQSVACDIVCDAMVRLSIHAVGSGNYYLHPIMNIHDDLTFAIPDDPKILEESIETIYRAMLSPPYEWINVPLSVECSVGDNWLDMAPIGKFWSQKDLK